MSQLSTPIIIAQYILSTYVLECLSISAYNYTVKYATKYSFLDNEIFSNLFSVFCMFNTFPCIFSILIALNNSNLLFYRGKVWHNKRPCLRSHISMSRTLEFTFNTNWRPCQKQFYCGESQKRMHQTIRILAVFNVCKQDWETQVINFCFSFGGSGNDEIP